MGYKLKDFPKSIQDQVNDKRVSNALDVCTGKQSIFINKLPPMLNGSNGLERMHWSEKRHRRARWVDFIFSTQPERHIGKVDVRFTRRSCQTPDPDNVSAGFKLVGDALVDLGVIEDDSFDVIRNFDVRWEKADSLRTQGVRIEIESLK